MEAKFLKYIVIAGSAALVATCSGASPSPGAQAAAGSGRQCFNATSINGFDAIDDDTVLVNIGAQNVYRLDIVGVCPDVDWSVRIGLRSTSGSSWICEAMDAELLVPSPTGLQRCPVVGVKKLTPAEVQALKAKRG